MTADTIAFRLTFLRNGGFRRFRKGTRSNLEAAREAGVISDIEYDSIWMDFHRSLAVLDERGARKGDQILYRIEGDSVHIAYVGRDEGVLIDTFRVGECWSRAVKELFLL